MGSSTTLHHPNCLIVPVLFALALFSANQPSSRHGLGASMGQWLFPVSSMNEARLCGRVWGRKFSHMDTSCSVHIALRVREWALTCLIYKHRDCSTLKNLKKRYKILRYTFSIIWKISFPLCIQQGCFWVQMLILAHRWVLLPFTCVLSFFGQRFFCAWGLALHEPWVCLQNSFGVFFHEYY